MSSPSSSGHNLERAKAQGKTLGWPPIDVKKEAAISADFARLGKPAS
jgi:hypothetical protein